MIDTARKHSRHTQEEDNWAAEKNSQFSKITAKTIVDEKILEEYREKFGKSLKVSSMYTYLRFAKYPEMKKKALQMASERIKDNRSSKPKSERKENQVFSNSEYIGYVNRRLIGFEDKAGLEKFMKDNLVLSGDFKIFKMLPVQVEYSVKIGE